MTCREKLAMEHPDLVRPDIIGGAWDCPHSYGYLPRPDYCMEYSCNNCTKCWDREIPEEKKEAPQYNPVAEAYKLLIGFHLNGKTTNFDQVIRYLGEAMESGSNANVAAAYRQLVNYLYLRVPIDFDEVLGYLGEILDIHPEDGVPIGKVKDIYEENGGITAVIEPTIKDSGNRTEFATGAVRDMREGKGRCDLMPLEVAAELLQTANCDFDPYIRRIKAFMDSGDTRWLKVCLMEFGTLSPAFKNIPTMLLEVAKHFEEGAKKYGENNWQKGIPVHCYIDSAVRHYLKWLRGDKDEPHDRAFVWNLMCCIWEVDYHEYGEEKQE